MKAYFVLLSAMMCFLLAFAARGQDEPRLVLADPQVGAPGATLNVTLTGENTHFGATSVAAFGADILVNGLAVANSATLTANVSIAWQPALGPRDVTVTTGSEIATGTGIFSVGGQMTFRFERMWPQLQQPWYLYSPTGVAVSPDGSVYISDGGSHDSSRLRPRILKFTSQGLFVTMWADTSWDWYPAGIAAAPDGSLYVINGGVDRIEKYTANGQLVRMWGSHGSGLGEFYFMNSLSVADDMSVYVADTYNDRIQKFTKDGDFVAAWGETGSGDGQFDGPDYICIGQDGSVYVLDRGNHRIQKFTSGGAFVSIWGAGHISNPDSIATGSDGYIRVLDQGNTRVQLLDSDGVVVSSWGVPSSIPRPILGYPMEIAVGPDSTIYFSDRHNSQVLAFAENGVLKNGWRSWGTDEGRMLQPWRTAVAPDGTILVLDTQNGRVERFTADGEFLAAWAGTIQDSAYGLAVGADGYVYVAAYADWKPSVLKYTLAGTFVTRWGQSGSGDGDFWVPCAIAVSPDNSVYVLDFMNDRVQRFTSGGDFIASWGGGITPFFSPMGIAIDSDGYVYVADTYNNQVQKFTADGEYVTQWGSGMVGMDVGPVFEARGIAVGPGNVVYLADTSHNRIALFTADGELVDSFGSIGSRAGQFAAPYDVSVDPMGYVYVADTENNRIQKFRPVTLTSHPKAIIVAGGGAYPGNDLWEATQACASFAYRVLACQGLTKETICYLSWDTDLDLDANGVADDVSSDATNANLESALTAWAPFQLQGLPTGDVVVYLVDHGGNAAFRMSGTEILAAADLVSWLDSLQQGIQGKVILVYDGCESGSFVSAVAPPPNYANKRIVITSTSPQESAHFVTNGTVSFSNFFWTRIFNGDSVGEAFAVAVDALSEALSFQHPLLDDNGNGIANETGDGIVAANTFIGNGASQRWGSPLIEAVSPPQSISDASTATVWADPVTDSDGVATVWAVIRLADYQGEAADNAVAGLPSVELLPTGEGSTHFEGTYNGFTRAGTYDVLVYARDRQGNTSAPVKTTVTVDNPLSRKALIVAGGSASDRAWPSIEHMAQGARQALKFQGYSDDDIYYLSDGASEGVDAPPTLANIEHSLTAWTAADTQDLTVYLTGPGQEQSFTVSSTETLAATQLDFWLDTLQATLPGRVTVIYDADFSGSFLPELIPPQDKPRLVLTSTDAVQTAEWLLDGDVSFSEYFWSRVLNGASVWKAFDYAAEAMRSAGNGQSAQLDDNADGIYSETDGVAARTYNLGFGVLLAGDDPLVGSIVGEQILIGGTSATLWVDHVTTTGIIDAVYALIVPPNSGAKVASAKSAGLTVALRQVGPHRYELEWSNFWATGDYLISVYAVDRHGNVSMPKQTVVHQENGQPDGDTDGDGLRDSWETTDLDPSTPGVWNPFDPFNTDSTGDNLNPHPDGVPDGQNDWDGDGMSNSDEFKFGFNPIDPESFGEMPLSPWLGVSVSLLGILRIALKRLHRR